MGCLVLIPLIVVVGLTVAFATGGSRGGRTRSDTTTEIQQVTQESFFDTIGGGPIIDGANCTRWYLW